MIARFKQVLVLVFLLTAVSAFSQIGGSNTFEFLNVPVSARTGALGGSVIAVYDSDPAISMVNPSLLNPQMDGMLTLSYLNYFTDINQGYFSYVKDFNKLGTFSAGLKYVNYGTFLETDEAGNEYGNFSASEYALIIGWGKTIVDSTFFVGANLKPIYSDLWVYYSNGIAADISGTYLSKDKSFTASLLVKNIGSQIKPYVSGGDREPIPFEVQAGISKRLKHVPFRLSVDVIQLQNWNLAYNDSIVATNANDNLDDEEKAYQNRTGKMNELFRHLVFGGEFVPSQSFMLRVGFNYKRRAELALDNKPGLVGFSWGVGFRIKKFHISYGSARYHLAGSSNHFTITTNLSEYYRKSAAPKPPKEKKEKRVKKDNNDNG
ncbi:MAG: type IX secretion system protein PorQ [Flavobacteriales bacterium]|nr:type IX secretion system protein PorQ [Flavobacteriales bacterium]